MIRYSREIRSLHSLENKKSFPTQILFHFNTFARHGRETTHIWSYAQANLRVISNKIIVIGRLKPSLLNNNNKKTRDDITTPMVLNVLMKVLNRPL